MRLLCCCSIISPLLLCVLSSSIINSEEEVSLTHNPISAAGHRSTPPAGPSDLDFLENLDQWRRDLIGERNRAYASNRPDKRETLFMSKGPAKQVWDQVRCSELFPSGVSFVKTLHRHTRKPDQHNKVYLVRPNRGPDEERDRLYVYKTFPRHDEFMAEFKFLSIADHPGIVRPICWSPSEDTSPPGIMLEWVDGGNRSAQWARDQKTMLPLKDLSAQLISAVLYMHWMGYVHGDIKPENIIVDPTGPRLVMIDFGYTAPVKEIVPKRGTPLYIPPEISANVVIDEDGEIVTDKGVSGSWEIALGFGSDWWSVGLTILYLYGEWVKSAADCPDHYHPVRRIRHSGRYAFEDASKMKGIPMTVKDFCHMLTPPNPLDRQFNTPRLVTHMLSHGMFEGIKWEQYYGPSLSSG